MSLLFKPMLIKVEFFDLLNRSGLSTKVPLPTRSTTLDRTRTPRQDTETRFNSLYYFETRTYVPMGLTVVYNGVRVPVRLGLPFPTRPRVFL